MKEIISLVTLLVIVYMGFLVLLVLVLGTVFPNAFAMIDSYISKKLYGWFK